MQGHHPSRQSVKLTHCTDSGKSQLTVAVWSTGSLPAKSFHFSVKLFSQLFLIELMTLRLVIHVDIELMLQNSAEALAIIISDEK